MLVLGEDNNGLDNSEDGDVVAIELLVEFKSLELDFKSSVRFLCLVGDRDFLSLGRVLERTCLDELLLRTAEDGEAELIRPDADRRTADPLLKF